MREREQLTGMGNQDSSNNGFCVKKSSSLVSSQPSAKLDGQHLTIAKMGKGVRNVWHVLGTPLSPVALETCIADGTLCGFPPCYTKSLNMDPRNDSELTILSSKCGEPE